MPRIIKYLLLLVIIIFGILLNSGCSTILFGPSGFIEITTTPSGAEIFLEGKDTGYITPYTITNLTKGTYEVTVILDDISYTETVIVYSNHITSVYKDFLSPRLEKINVLPWWTTITLSLGNTVTISSVTAYYSDYSSANIPLTDCTYSSDCTCATVNSSGTITGISAGAATITVSYTEGSITKTDTVLVDIRNIPTDTPISPPVQDDIVYRALLVGVGNYENFPDYYPNPIETTDLNGPPYDVDRMIGVFNHCKFGTEEVNFSSIVPLKNLSTTKAAIMSGIASTFSGADDNDISYFYFSGHGYLDTGTNISYLLPTDTNLIIDLNTMISVDELEIALSAIPGTKVVILDSCNSGGFIGKGKGKITISKEDLESFNNEIINIFSQAQSKGLLTTNQYKVLTSCHDYQECLEWSPHPLDGNPFGRFSAALCEGCGYNSFSSPYPADINENNKVTLQEAYLYVESTLESLEQDVQVYPTNSTFTIVEY